MFTSLDKKAADEVKRKIGNILLMGRSLGIHLIIGIQRADAEYFRAGARDQFGAILMLGNLSKEQKAMLALDYRDEMTATNTRGQGYLLLDGQGLHHIQVPRVNDINKLQHQIINRTGLLYLPPGGFILYPTFRLNNNIEISFMRSPKHGRRFAGVFIQ